MIKLIQGDCLIEMDKLIEKGIIVDAIITDPPYGITACKWDSIIPFDEMWKRLNKLIKSNGAIVLFGSEPFSSYLRISNIKNYKYDWIWEKTVASNFALSNKQPHKKHEVISIFYKKQPNYNPQMMDGKPYIDVRKNNYRRSISVNDNNSLVKKPIYNKGTRYPFSVIKYSNGNNKRFHPTQKPIPLMEYLVRTYTNESETVLDFTMGSGSTLLACRNTNRNGIGIELDKGYFEIAKKRVSKPELFNRSEQCKTQ